jgi:hypothetical protein
MQITVISIQSVPGKAPVWPVRPPWQRLGVVQRAGIGGDQADAQDEAEVADAVDQEGLHVGEDGGRLLVPEADQQVGHQAHRLPAEEQLQEVVAHHQHQHGEREQRDVGEEALVAVVLFHVADGVDVHHQRHEGHHAHHHGGQAVDQEADLHLQPPTTIQV